jgi:CysZ protein
MKQFFKGLSYNMVGIRYFFANRSLWKFAIIPTVINFFALVLLIAFFVGYFSDVFALLIKPLGGLNVANPHGFWLHFVDGILFVLRVLFEVIFFFISLIVIVMAVFVLSMIVNGPFYEMLAEKIILLKGNSSEATLKLSSWARNFFYSLKTELKKTLLFIGVTLCLFILSFIPVVGVVFSVGIFLFSAWMFAFSLSTYPLVIERRPFGEILRWGLKRKMLLLGLGLPSLVPFVGLVIMFFQVAGGTVMYFDITNSIDAPKTSNIKALT